MGTAQHAHTSSIAAPSGGLPGGPRIRFCIGDALMLELGAQVPMTQGNPIAPSGVVIESIAASRWKKLNLLESNVQYGIELPDTPLMARHRGRMDLLEPHLRRARTARAHLFFA